MKKIVLRAIRKTSHVGNRALAKGLRFGSKVENKADRILNGTDFSMRIEETVPIEKLYFTNQKWITPLNPALPTLDQAKSVTLLIPSLDGRSFYGGTATALYAAGRIAQLTERPLRIVQTLKTGYPKNLKKFFAEADIHVSDITVTSVADRAYNVYGYLPMHRDDIFIASAWWDAYLLSQLPLTKKFVYLVQDFEPIFYNNSDSYVLAESTYKLRDKFVPLCNTKLMYDFMKERSYPAFLEGKPQWFEPAVSRIKSGLVAKKQKGEKRRLFLYGRPDVHRNLFFTAINAIDYAFKSGFLNGDEWEIFMAGQSDLPDIKLPSGKVIKNLGKMDMDEYINFSKTIDLAISPMMAPHPNYPTLEFSSIGTAVVTTKYANKTDLSRYSKNIVMSEIDAESMAGAILKASQITPAARQANAKSSDIPTDWSTSLDKPLKEVLKQIAPSE